MWLVMITVPILHYQCATDLVSSRSLPIKEYLSIWSNICVATFHTWSGASTKQDAPFGYRAQVTKQFISLSQKECYPRKWHFRHSHFSANVYMKHFSKTKLRSKSPLPMYSFTNGNQNRNYELIATLCYDDLMFKWFCIIRISKLHHYHVHYWMRSSNSTYASQIHMFSLGRESFWLQGTPKKKV